MSRRDLTSDPKIVGRGSRMASLNLSARCPAPMPIHQRSVRSTQRKLNIHQLITLCGNVSAYVRSRVIQRAMIAHRPDPMRCGTRNSAGGYATRCFTPEWSSPSSQIHTLPCCNGVTISSHTVFKPRGPFTENHMLSPWEMEITGVPPFCSQVWPGAQKLSVCQPTQVSPLSSPGVLADGYQCKVRLFGKLPCTHGGSKCLSRSHT